MSRLIRKRPTTPLVLTGIEWGTRSRLSWKFKRQPVENTNPAFSLPVLSGGSAGRLRQCQRAQPNTGDHFVYTLLPCE